MDQANQLRYLMNNSKPKIKKTINARVMTVSSGKGGVGKSNFSINLAIYFASLKKRVVVIDADFGLANIEVLLGIRPEYSFYHMLSGEKNMAEVMVDTKYGIKLISGGSGFKELSNLNNNEINLFIEQLDYIDKIADIIIIDTGAGISKSVTNFIAASDETIIVTTPEPTSFIDAYTLIKVIKENNSEIEKLKLVINKVDDKYEAERVFNKIYNVADKFLNIEIENTGYVLSDSYLLRAVKNQNPAILSYPNSDFSNSIKKIGDRLIKDKESEFTNQGITSFMEKFIKIFKK